MRNLAPNIYRQRLIIEGICEKKITPVHITTYLEELAKVLKMVVLKQAEAYFSEEHGHCGYQHWVTSGVHMYTWEHYNPIFFSVDIYTCKPFNAETAVTFTTEFFKEKCNLIDIDFREV